MLTAVMMNREEKITEDKKDEYLTAGYDVIDANGVRTPSPSKKVSYTEYAAIKKELDITKANLVERDIAHETLVEDFNKLKSENEKLKKELEKAKKAGA